MSAEFPIERRPRRGHDLPVLVTVPHFGTRPLPDLAAGAFTERRFETLPAGFADAFAAELYGGLDESGATILASPYSRLFVDLNRARDDFERRDGAICSKRGVVRTHMIRDEPIFAAPLVERELEQRLASFYDPFHARLKRLARALRARHGRAVVIDGHTAIGRRIGNHQIIIGTRGGNTCRPALSEHAELVFRSRGFEVHHDVPGYKGGHIVRTASRLEGVEAIQIEVNARLLMRTTREDFIARQVRGERPAYDGHVLARLHRALDELVRSAPGLVADARVG